MNTRFLILFLLAGVSAFAQNFMPDQLLIQVSRSSDCSRVIAQLAETENTEIIALKKISNPLNVFQVTFQEGSNLDRLIKSSYFYSEILNIQKNHIIEDRFTPNDPSFSSQWHLHNTGQTGGLNDADIDAPEAWDITTGGQSALDDTIVVCIIESTGVDIGHEDLEGNVWKNYEEIEGNGIDDDNNGYIDDFHGWNLQSGNDVINAGGHGTKVAGIVGATGDNNTGISGVNHRVKMMIIEGQVAANEASVLAAYSYPLDMRKRYNLTNGQSGAFVVVTNASWGLDGLSPSDSPLWCAMYDSLGQHGIINVGATTNSNVNVDVVGDLPTSCPSEYLISVTASNSSDQRAGSGYGVQHIDLAAPGSGVLTTTSFDNYVTDSGTSFAAPNVTGAIALLYSAQCPNFIALAKNFPDSAARKVRSYILDNVDAVSALSGEVSTGGRLNVHQAIQGLLNDCDNNPCVSPYGLTLNNLTDSAATFTWAATNASDFILQIIDGNNVSQSINLSTTSYSFNDLTPCTNYEVFVRGICGMDTSSATAVISFQTDGCCENPELTQGVTTPTSIELNWNSVLYATEYIIRHQLSGELIWNYDTITSNSFVIPDLDTCSQYTIQIKTVCTDSTRGFSDFYAFSTIGCGICYDGEYCEIDPLAVGSNAEWIESVKINGYTSTTGNNGGYYFGNIFTSGFKPDHSYQFTFTPGYSGFNYTEHFSLWLDLDQSGTFETSELLINNLTGVGVQSGMLYVPAFTGSGITKMRIAMTGDNPPSLCADQGGNIYGEYEDYCVQIGGTASVDSVNGSVSLYPNPTHGVININTLGEVNNINVFNIYGQLVMSQNSPDSIIDISKLSKGTYIIQVTVNQEIYRMPIIKI